MRKILLSIFVCLALPLAAQTVTCIVTPTVSSGAVSFSVSCPSTTPPAGVTVSNGAWTFSDPITLPGTLPASSSGEYLFGLTNGVLTPIPYVPPAASTSTTSTSSCTALTPVAIPATTAVIAAGEGTPNVTVTNSAVLATSHVFITPTFVGSTQFPTNFEPFAKIPYAGAINIYARFMPYGTPQSFPGGTVNVEVCP